MTTKAIQVTYHFTFTDRTTFEEINNKLNIDFEKDVETYYVKWSILHLIMKDGTYKEYALPCPEIYTDDCKRPDDVEIVDDV